MKKKACLMIISLLCCCCFIPGVAGADSNASKTDNDYKVLVLDVINKHPLVKKLNKLKNIADKDVDIAVGGYYPVVNISASRGREWARNTTTKDDSVSHYVPKYSLTVRQPVYDGENVRSRVNKNKALAERSYHDIQDGQENLALRLTDAYLDILRTKEQISLAEQNLQAHQEILDIVQTRFKNKLVSQADVVQVQGRLALAEAELRRNKNDLSNAGIMFYELTDRHPGELVEPASPAKQLPLDLKSAVDITLGSHPAVLGTTKTIEAVDASIKEAKSALYPKLSVELSGTRDENTGGYENKDILFSAMVVMDWNIFRGFSDEAVIAREELRREKELEQFKETKRLLLRDLSAAWNTRSNRELELVYHKQHLTAAEKSYNAYKVQYEMGKQRTLFDVLNARSEFFIARFSVIDTQYSIKSSEFRILAAMGRLVDYVKTLI
jgi:outer membrane protein, adhesin transport system